MDRAERPRRWLGSLCRLMPRTHAAPIEDTPACRGLVTFFFSMHSSDVMADADPCHTHPAHCIINPSIRTGTRTKPSECRSSVVRSTDRARSQSPLLFFPLGDRKGPNAASSSKTPSTMELPPTREVEGPLPPTMVRSIEDCGSACLAWRAWLSIRLVGFGRTDV